MIKRIVGLLVFGLFCLSLFAENGTVVLVNRRSYWFYYCIDPQGVDDFTKDATEYLNSEKVTFYAIGPESTRKIDGVKAGTHYLLGFWGISDKEQVPVLSKRFLVNDDEIVEFDLANETYQVAVKEPGEEKHPVTVIPGKIVIDNNYDDWKIIPPAAVFTPAFIPQYFNKQSLTGSNYLPIANSLFWGRGGTSINQVKLYRDGDYLYVYISSYSRMTAGLSYYLYLFKSRSRQEQNNYTIEFVVDDMAATGKVILWQKDRKNYQVIGELMDSSFFLEARLEIGKLPAPLDEIIAHYSFDLTSSYYDSRLKVYEEFFFTTLYGKDIVTRQDLKLK
jgi:hypothetical protein